MSKEYGRNVRVADLIQRALATLIERDRMSQSGALITVSNVNVSPDLKNAKVYVTVLGDTDEKQLVSELQENAGHYRHHLSKQLNLRYMPKLTFHYDQQLVQANRLTAIIDGLADDTNKKD